MVRKNGVITIAQAARLLSALKKKSTDELVHQIRFVMVGDGPDLSFVKKIVRGVPLDSLLLLPAMPMEHIIGVADIFMTHVSSLVPGFGLTILEAMAAGVPVITGFDAIKQKFFTHGQDIYYVKKDDPQDLLKAVINLCQNSELRAKIAFNAYVKILRNFDYKLIMKKTFLIFEKLFYSSNNDHQIPRNA